MYIYDISHLRVNLEMPPSNLGRNIVCYEGGFRGFFNFLRAYGGIVIKTVIVPFHIFSTSTHIELLDAIMLRKYKSSYVATQSSRPEYAGVARLFGHLRQANNHNSNPLQKINTIHGILFYLGQNSKFLWAKDKKNLI